MGKWDLLVRITMEPLIEVEILRTAYTIEIVEVHFLGVGHVSPTDVDTDFCSYGIYELRRELSLLLVESILIWHAENNVPVLVLWFFYSHISQRMHPTLLISDLKFKKSFILIYVVGNVRIIYTTGHRGGVFRIPASYSGDPGFNFRFANWLFWWNHFTVYSILPNRYRDTSLNEAVILLSAYKALLASLSTLYSLSYRLRR